MGTGFIRDTVPRILNDALHCVFLLLQILCSQWNGIEVRPKLASDFHSEVRWNFVNVLAQNVSSPLN